ncbi:MAG: efflux RND transporter periplasmic adaptor subunit [Rikenellaceae bacterium]|nr:efflux RND transporter periplasmic adaptor subunit [Rikenellaceae bacterium]
MKKNLVLATVVAVSLSMVGCGGKKEQSVEVIQPEKVLIKTAEAISAPVGQLVEVSANIQPYKQNSITPAVQGVRIDQILVDVGHHVSKGQLVATMDPIQYNQANTQLLSLEADLARMTPVFEAGGISAQQLDAMKTQVAIQRDVVANLKKNIELRSPISGVVTARNAEAGDMFANMPILQIMQINPLKITASISEKYFSKVKMNMPVEIATEVLPDEKFMGKVSLIYPAMDAATRTFTVEITIPNAGNKLRPGMFARAIFNLGEVESVLVPDVAIKRQAGTNERAVFVVKADGTVERRVVELGRQIEKNYVILSGLNAGEQVSVTGLSKLDDGTAVEISK